MSFESCKYHIFKYFYLIFQILFFLKTSRGSLIAVDNTIKLFGAGAFAFHPTLEWVFVGDRRGTLLAWDVSTERPIMIGMYVPS